MDEDGESSDGEGGRIAVIQRQAKRRMLNLRHATRESVDTTATLPEYTSSPPAESSGTEAMTLRVVEAPPKYPQLTAEEADEERDEVGDVVRRVRVRRRRSMSMSSSSSDPYLDSLLARSVHALELSNALLQSSMSTQSSLSALLSHDDRTLDRSLDSHARFLTTQIHASDARRAWVDDIARQVDSLEYEYPPPSPATSGLSQSLPDTQGGFMDRMRAARIGTEFEDVDILPARPRRREGGLQRGERPRSPPPRCMTQYINAEGNVSDGPDSILLPSTNGLRAGPRVHALVEAWHSRKSSGSRNHSRRSSVEWGEFARQQQHQWGTGSSTPVTPRSSVTHSPHRSMSVSAQHSPRVPLPTNRVYQHGNMSSPQVLQHSSPQTQHHSTKYASHQSHTPIRPVVSAVPAEPSTPAYNMLSAIAMRSPGSGNNSDSGGATRSDLGPRFINDLGPRFINDLGGSEIVRAELEGRSGRARGGSGSGTWVVASGSGGLRRTRSTTPNSRGGFVSGGPSPVISPSRLKGTSTGTATATNTTISSPSNPNPLLGSTSSPRTSKPPTRASSRTASTASVGSASVPGPIRHGSLATSSPGRAIRHPYLQPDPLRSRQNPNQTQSDVETDLEALHKFRSADALRRILDASKPQHDEPEEQQQDEPEGEEDEGEERGRGTVRSKGKQPARPRPKLPTWSMIPRTGTTVKVETVAPGGVVSIEGISGASTGGSKSAVEARFGRQGQGDPLELPGEHVRAPLSAGEHVRSVVSREHVRPSVTREHTRLAIAVPQRSRSAGPSNRLGSLFSAASLPKISVFGKSGEPEPPPTISDSPERREEAERGGGEVVVEGNGDKPVAERSGDKPATERERPRLAPINTGVDGLPRPGEDVGVGGIDGLPTGSGLRVQLNGATIDTDAGPSEVSLSSESGSENGSQPSHASLPLPPRFFEHYHEGSGRPSSLRLSGSPRPSSLRQPGSGASTPRSVTFSPLPPKHVSSGSRPLSEAKARRRKNGKEKENAKPGWFASWFGPLPSPSGSSVKSGAGYGAVRRGWDSPRSMDDWQM
ncbi:hypothetical protein FRC12_010250 [Ceratobasidium sp. 428]|nr:hypothetical protein FRC12_010250 [Ceratobasidium sp. 428]